MVVWMRYGGHAWRPNIEMAASMLIPAFVVMGSQLLLEGSEWSAGDRGRLLGGDPDGA